MTDPRGQPLPQQEYSWYFDTNNRERVTDKENSDNPTNDIYLPTRLAQHKLQVQSLHLATLEMPLAQFTVEADWNRLYFDEGLNLIVHSVSDEPLTQFIISENGDFVMAQLPPHLNAITAVDISTPTAPIFTTAHPHGLDIVASYNWGDDIRIIGTLLTGDDTHITSNSSLTIIDDTSFQVSGLTAVAYTATDSIFGYIWSPVIPNANYLAQLVTASLNNQVPGHWTVSYDRTTTRFQLCWAGSGCAASDISPATLIIPSTNSLPALMGFGYIDIDIPLPPPEAKPFETDIQFLTRHQFDEPAPTCLVASGCYACRTYIEIDPRNYDPSTLGADLSLQWNRFYFEPGCDASSPDTSYTFNFSTPCGECKSVTIEPGLYAPETLADHIEALINAADGTNTYTVTYNSADGTFTIAGIEDFDLEFDQATGNLSTRMGFDPIFYRNGNSYTSPNPFHVPTKNCCGTEMSNRYLSYVYSPLLSTAERSYTIQIANERCSNASTAVDNGDGTMTVLAISSNGPTNLAHGFQVDDVVAINNGTDTFFLRVSAVVDWHEFTVELGSVPFAQFSGTLCVCPAEPVVANMYFRQCSSRYTMPNIFPGRLLGFGARDVLWSPGFNGFKSTGNYDFDWPFYVLVEIADPQEGATRNEHSWVAGDRETHKTRILAKVLLYPQLRMERIYPMKLQFPMYSPKTLRRVKLRILNPDHTLYQFHQRNWSGTMVMETITGRPVGAVPVGVPLAQ